MSVSKRLRFEVLRRDGFRCRYCGATAPTVPLRVDHLTPAALGGADTMENLVTACEPCNSGKTSTLPDAPLLDVISAAVEPSEISRVVADLIGTYHPEAFTMLFPELAECGRNGVVYIWRRAWAGSFGDEPRASFERAYMASFTPGVQLTHSVPVLYGAAELTGAAGEIDVEPYAELLTAAVRAELRRA